MSERERFKSIFRPGLFGGSVVFITGGGTGLGRCAAHELASLGATVVIAGRRPEPLQQTLDEIAACGGKCDTVQLDVRDDGAVDRVVSEVVSKHGRIDALINNAGGQFAALTDKISPNGWRSVLDLNLTGTFLVSVAVYRHSMEENGGAIVNMLADIWTGYPGWAHMTAARGGIEILSRTLALEWAARGIRVNCVAPGTILTAGLLTYPEEVQRLAVKGSRGLPASRLGTESEVSAAITFLLSPAAAYITGETIAIDGGSRFQKGRLIPIGDHDRSKAWDGFHLRPDFTGTPYEEIT